MDPHWQIACVGVGGLTKSVGVCHLLSATLIISNVTKSWHTVVLCGRGLGRKWGLLNDRKGVGMGRCRVVMQLPILRLPDFCRLLAQGQERFCSHCDGEMRVGSPSLKSPTEQHEV